MDTDIRAEFDIVHADIRALDGRVQGLDERVQGLDERVQRLDGRVSAVEERLQILDDRIREEGVATRRHFDVVAESLRDDIRIIAEGLVTLTVRVDRIGYDS